MYMFSGNKFPLLVHNKLNSKCWGALVKRSHAETYKNVFHFGNENSKNLICVCVCVCVIIYNHIASQCPVFLIFLIPFLYIYQDFSVLNDLILNWIPLYICEHRGSNGWFKFISEVRWEGQTQFESSELVVGNRLKWPCTFGRPIGQVCSLHDKVPSVLA